MLDKIREEARYVIACMCYCCTYLIIHSLCDRQKKLQEQATSARTLALQADAKRKLNKAIEFHRKLLLIRYGFSPWIRFTEQRR
jgi:hypothetical protein